MSKAMWDEIFSSETYQYGEAPNQFIYEMVTKKELGGVVACFAEGEGRNANFFASRGADVTAFDQSLVGLEKAHKLAEKNGHSIIIHQCDLVNDVIPYQAFDTAINVFGHVHESEQEAFFNNMINAVKPGGHFLFEVYSEKQIDYKTGGPRNKAILYDPALLFKVIGHHDILHFYCGEAERVEGEKHTGLCHVVQGVIRICE